jgi:hypothetical protein
MSPAAPYQIYFAIRRAEEDLAAIVSSLRNVVKALRHDDTCKPRHTSEWPHELKFSENLRNLRLSRFPPVSPPGFPRFPPPKS